MPATPNVKLYHKSPVVAKITLSYSAEAIADYDIDPVDEFPSDATVTFNLHLNSEAGTKVVDALSLDYETGSDGVYIGTAEAPSPAIAKGQKYFWSIKVVSADSIEQHFSGFETARYNHGD